MIISHALMLKIKKNKKVIIIVTAVIILALFFLRSPLMNRSQMKVEKECVIQECHGLDITCGMTGPQICTLEYQLGDFCRNYVSCQLRNNNCEVVTDPLFEQCTSCVNKCALITSPIEAFQCEEKCRSALK